MTAGRERGVMVWDVRERLLQQRYEAVNLELAQLGPSPRAKMG
jgi:hypothetical protein